MELFAEIIDIAPIAIIFFIFGLAFGSFATMASHRMPLGEDLVVKRSYCPSCKHLLGIVDLFPLFSWVFSKGKCRHCQSKISCRYPLTELATACLFTVIYLKTGLNLTTIALLLLAVCLVIIIVVDIEHKIIPDTMQIAMIPIGMLYLYSVDAEWKEYLVGPAIGLFVALSLRYGFFLWKKKEGLGMGDVKFFCVAGLFLGVEGFAPFMLISGLTGIVMAFIWKKLGRGEEFPFAPSLAVSLFLCVTFPEYIVDPLSVTK